MTREEYEKMIKSMDFLSHSAFLSSSEFRLLLSLSTYHPCICSMQEMAQNCGIGITTVKCAIKKMTNTKILKKISGWRVVEGKKTRINSYEINYQLVRELYESSKNNN